MSAKIKMGDRVRIAKGAGEGLQGTAHSWYGDTYWVVFLDNGDRTNVHEDRLEMAEQ